jgi:hypothetical protein
MQAFPWKNLLLAGPVPATRSVASEKNARRGGLVARVQRIQTRVRYEHLFSVLPQVDTDCRRHYAGHGVYVRHRCSRFWHLQPGGGQKKGREARTQEE